MASPDSATDTPSPSPPATASAPGPGQFVWWWRWFWRLVLVISLPYAWYCFYVPANKVAWADNYAAAQQQAAQTGKPMLLFFTGKWCVPCRIMKRNVWADQQVTAEVNAAFIPVLIDVDDPAAAAALSHYHIGGTPSTIITDPDGNVLQQITGGMGKSEFLEWLQKPNPST